MKPHSLSSGRVTIATVVLVAGLQALVLGQTAREQYESLLDRDQKITAAIRNLPGDSPADARASVIREARSVIAGYDALVRRHHSSGYADNALWNAGSLADALAAQFSRPQDKALASRYIKRLQVEYPTSSLTRRLAKTVGAPASPPASTPAPTAATATRPAAATLTSIERTVLPDVVRVTLALDREVGYHEERLGGPARLFFDLKGVQTTSELKDAVLRYPSDAVRQIRVGRHPDTTVRVVLDLDGIRNYSVFNLYNPFRVVVDLVPEMATTAKAAAPAVLGPPRPPSPAPPAAPKAAAIALIALRTAPAEHRTGASTSIEAPPADVLPSLATLPDPAAAPTAPSSNRTGGFSLSRQLGLGVTRVVIDPGHGGHDPGAIEKGLTEADLTLDIALRLEKLLQDEGLDVVLTRRTNVYIPLEERTAIANRESADLFLSIHANASKNDTARGVETYFLSFASSPEAEAVAARENSDNSGEMHNLPDIIKAIALNNKLDESRDFAGMVQEALVSRLRRSNKNVRNLGVKKAPFVVLIGAGMPSVLAEVSFVTNRQELQLLKTATYKQRIAEALQAAVLRYRRSLKGQGQVADK